MKISSRLIVSLIFIGLIFGQNFAAVVERQQYPKLLVNSKISGLNLDTAFDFSNFDHKNGQITASEGTIDQERSDFYNTLPESFQTATILRFTTENAFLEVIGWNNKSKICAMALWLDQNSVWMNDFTNLGRNECAGLQATRSDNPLIKLISYVNEEDGTFNHFKLEGVDSKFSSWTRSSGDNLYEKEVLIKGETHHVTMTKQYAGDGKTTDYRKNYVKFVLWQRNSDLDGNYPKSSLVLINKVYTPGQPYNFEYDYDNEINFVGLIKKKENKIRWANWQHWWDKNQYTGGNNIVFINWQNNYDKDPKFPIETPYIEPRMDVYYNNDFTLPRERSPVHNGLVGMTFDYNKRKFYYEVDIDKNTIMICIPSDKTDTFYWRRLFIESCVTENLEEKFNIDSDEFIDDVQIRADYVVTITIKRKGKPYKLRTRVFNLKDVQLPPLEENSLTTTNTEAFFSMPNRFRDGDDRKIHVMETGKVKFTYIWKAPMTLSGNPIVITAKDESNEATHTINFEKTEKFSSFSVGKPGDTVYVESNHYGKISTSSDADVKVSGDILMSIVDLNLNSWVGLTPLIDERGPQSQSLNSLLKKRIFANRGIQQKVDTKLNLLEAICKFETLTVFVNPETNLIHSFSPIVTSSQQQLTKKTEDPRNILISLEHLKISSKDIHCGEDSSILISTDGSTQITTIISFDYTKYEEPLPPSSGSEEPTPSSNIKSNWFVNLLKNKFSSFYQTQEEKWRGQYLVRQFYSSLEIDQIKSIKLVSRNNLRYVVLTNDEKRVDIEFFKMYPLFKIENSDITELKAKINDNEVEFEFEEA